MYVLNYLSPQSYLQSYQIWLTKIRRSALVCLPLTQPPTPAVTLKYRNCWYLLAKAQFVCYFILYLYYINKVGTYDAKLIDFKRNEWKHESDQHFRSIVFFCFFFQHFFQKWPKKREKNGITIKPSVRLSSSFRHRS